MWVQIKNKQQTKKKFLLKEKIMKKEKIENEELSEIELVNFYERYCSKLDTTPGRLQALWVACYVDRKKLYEVKVDRSLIMLGDITPAIRIDSFKRFRKSINNGYIEISSCIKKAEQEDENTLSL